MLLDRDGYIVIPAFGTIYINKIPSRINGQSSKIESPNYTLEFKYGQLTKLNSQINKLSKLWGVSRVEANNIYNKFGIFLLDQLESANNVKLPGFGVFQKVDDNISFISSKEVELSYNYFNRDVSLIKKFQYRTKESQKDFNHDEKMIAIHPKYWRSVAAVLLFIVTLFIGLSVIGPESNFINPVSFDLNSYDYGVEEFNRKPESDGSENNIDKILPIDSNVNNIPSEDSINDEDYNMQNEVQDQTTDVDEPFSDSDNSIIPNKSEETQNDAQESCIFITGSFGSTVNVNRMISKLKNKGFTVYKEPYKNITRVGVVISCNDPATLKTLESIENEFWKLEQ